jgi:hypothetical protein
VLEMMSAMIGGEMAALMLYENRTAKLSDTQKDKIRCTAVSFLFDKAIFI